MKSIQTCLIVSAVLVGAIGDAAAQSAQSDSKDFTSDRWQLFTMTDQAIAGVRGEEADDMMLFTCTERPRTLSLTIHPPVQDLSEQAYATLAFDGAAPIDAEVPLMNVVGNILFLLADRDPSFQRVAEKFMTAEAVEIAIVQSRAVRSRHTFTLKGAAEAIAPALKLCGR